MPRYEVAARHRTAASPAQVWQLLAEVDPWVAPAGAEVMVEVLEAVPGEHLTYRITSGLPVREHRARVELQARDGGTDICWSHTFRPRIPGTGGFLRGRLERQAADAAGRLAAASVA